jgi:hypothetical protein
MPFTPFPGVCATCGDPSHPTHYCPHHPPTQLDPDAPPVPPEQQPPRGFQLTMPITLPLIAEFDADVTTHERARAILDQFREAVLPAQNYGITLYEPDETRTTTANDLTLGHSEQSPTVLAAEMRRMLEHVQCYCPVFVQDQIRALLYPTNQSEVAPSAMLQQRSRPMLGRRAVALTPNERIISELERTTPNREVRISVHTLLRLIADADRALDGDANDDEHDALFELRHALAEYAGAPDRIDHE